MSIYRTVAVVAVETARRAPGYFILIGDIAPSSTGDVSEVARA